MIRRLVVLVGFPVAVLVVPAAPASAHSGSGSVGPSNFLTELSGVEPAAPDVRVRVLDLGDQLELTNRGEDDVIVLGYEDEPYLRIGPDGVFENRLSTATYINTEREADVDIPDDVDAEARPEWRKVSDGQTARWHDHRTHWMATDDPPAVAADPNRSHVILERWEVPFDIGDQRSTITGTLTWSPGPNVLLWLALGGGFAAATMAAFVVFRSRRVTVLAAVVAIVVLVGIAQTIGLAFAPNQVGPPVLRFLATAIYPAMGWIAGVFAVLWLVRRRPDGVYIAAMAGAVALLVGGLSDLSVLTRAHVQFGADADLARAAVALSLGGGSAVLGMCLALKPKQAVKTGVLR